MKRARSGLCVAAVLVAALVATAPGGGSTAAAGQPGGESEAAAHWTAARMAAATPRDLVVDQRGLAYLRRPDGSLQPHGHSARQLWASPAPTSRPTAAAKPGGGGGDTSGPSVTGRDPGADATIGASHTFRATVTDPSGVKSVSFVIVSPNGQAQSFAASASGDVWSVNLSGFTNGSWGWHIVARDRARRTNTTTTPTTGFTVATGGGGGGGGTNVANADWTGGGTVQSAAGRIYFEMPSNAAQTRWSGYVCSGTVADDAATSARSVIITAAHCVYDDVYKVFARNVLFIPNQDATTGTGTDQNCSNDPSGCWSPSFGVVDTDWSSRTFPDNIPWDYGYYVVSDIGAHSGTAAGSDALDTAVGDLEVQFTAPAAGVLAHALGYSYSDDPNLMHCAEPLGTESDYGDWWLGQCDLSGGASGGPWMQPVDDGEGPIISINSWGYTNQPGMAGPVLSGASSAGCLFELAKVQGFAAVSGRGVTSAC